MIWMHIGAHEDLKGCVDCIRITSEILAETTPVANITILSPLQTLAEQTVSSPQPIYIFRGDASLIELHSSLYNEI